MKLWRGQPNHACRTPGLDDLGTATEARIPVGSARFPLILAPMAFWPRFSHPLDYPLKTKSPTHFQCFGIETPTFTGNTAYSFTYWGITMQTNTTGTHQIILSDANITHSHIYLTSLKSIFPSNVFGGSNKSKRAPRTLTIHMQGMESIETDIDSKKNIFRERGRIGEFIRRHNLRGGDSVYIEKLSLYEYRLGTKQSSLSYDAQKPAELSASHGCMPRLIDFPIHGAIACRQCFPNAEDVITDHKWRICNDPGSWGSSSPEILVLGYSKGFTQADAYQKGDFDKVAFAECRPRLKSILVRLGLWTENQDIENAFTSGERRLAFGSLVRCSLSRYDENDRRWKATGPLIKKSFEEYPALSYIQNCTQRFLKHLPHNLKLVIFLGNDTGYIQGVREVVKILHQDSFRDIAATAYVASGVTWAHAAHPSGNNGHLSTWLEGPSSTTQGEKREMTLQALKLAGY